ncbi:MAG: glycosyltransferase family 2 protein [Kiritimatiellae bacterium]|nr:glycosyltransferase family 2 protein [Kiritimatiellia bacterium]MDD5521705.1 glycosyltransferase family 2 protein [Kiritimatiellia bacterium]
MKEIFHKPGGLHQPFPKVGVVIVTWNRKDYVLRLLDSLKVNAYPNWRVLVVDNASTDGSEEAIRRNHEWVHCLKNPINVGGSGGFNTGLTFFLNEGGYDYIWLLDNDVEVDPGALEVLVESLETHHDAAVAGSHMIQLDGKHLTNEIGADCNLAGGRLELCLHGSLPWIHGNEVYDVDYVAACSMLVRFDVMKKVGIMDDFFIHFDDVDWCLRFREAGYRTIACSASRIRHLSGRSKRVTWVLYYDVRNMLYLQYRHGEFGLGHFIKAFMLVIGRGFRDELSGKDYYGKLAELAWKDFLCGKMGKRSDLPSLQVKPGRKVLDRILSEKGKKVFTMEPLCRTFITEESMAIADGNGTTLTAICHEAGIGTGQLPEKADRLFFPANRIKRGLAMIKMAFTGPRPDYLILDIDKLCGFLGLFSSRIILLVDDGCIEVRGGWIRLVNALWWPVRWIVMLPKLLLFVVMGRWNKETMIYRYGP